MQVEVEMSVVVLFQLERECVCVPAMLRGVALRLWG